MLVYHSGVEINGREYTFGSGGGGTGVVEHQPKAAYGQANGNWIYDKTVELGKANKTTAEIRSVIGATFSR